MIIEVENPNIIENEVAMEKAIENSFADYLILKGKHRCYHFFGNDLLLLKDLSIRFPKEAYKDPIKYYLSLSKNERKKYKDSLLIKNHPDVIKYYRKRDSYSKIFSPTISIFSDTSFSFPQGEVAESYYLDDGSKIEILDVGLERKLYKLIPIEFSMSTNELTKLSSDIEKEKEGIETGNDLAKRYASGYGVLEILSLDEEIEDINFNGFPDSLRIVHSRYEEMNSNIFIGNRDVLSWSTKIKLYSKRPFDYVNPVLDSKFYGIKNSRVTFLRPPLSDSISFSIRKHRDKPWTYPLLIKYKFMSPLAAAFFDILSVYSKTMLFAGSRGAGKTSMLGATLFEISNKYRMIVLEDTEELPVSHLRDVGYDVMHLKVRSPLSLDEGEVSAETGLRASLRLGDSCLIIGEIRSNEASVLYEAMRVGALSNVVAGTVHAESPYGVFDRVVNELGVKATSFKATDIIAIVRPIRDLTMKRKRVITSIVEVTKHWNSDPLLEEGFVELFTYDYKKDTLVPTEEFKEGDTDLLRSIRSNVREWQDHSNFLKHLDMRAAIKQRLIDLSDEHEEVLEHNFVSRANSKLNEIMARLTERYGYPSEKKVIKEFNLWLKERRFE